MQISSEAIPCTGVDSQGKLILSENEAKVPWDNPIQFIDSVDKVETGVNLNNWSVYERLNEQTALQELNSATRESAAVELLKLNREDGTIVVCHDPLGEEANSGQNFTCWNETVISDLGFRQVIFFELA